MRTATVFAPANVWARIDLAGSRVVPEEVTLSVSGKDQVEWYSDDDQSFLVDFGARTPFATAHFHVPNSGSVCSGAPRSSANGTYKYTVFDEAGHQVVDPRIVIRA